MQTQHICPQHGVLLTMGREPKFCDQCGSKIVVEKYEADIDDADFQVEVTMPTSEGFWWKWEPSWTAPGWQLVEVTEEIDDSSDDHIFVFEPPNIVAPKRCAPGRWIKIAQPVG